MTVLSKGTFRIFSIGHSNRSIESFLSLLFRSSIRVVADIRSNPSSSRYPHFERHFLSSRLSEFNISYRWFRSLGGRVEKNISSLRHDALPEFLRPYAERMRENDFVRVVDELIGLASSVTTVLLCSEKEVIRCHRWLLSDLLLFKGASVIHIIDEEKTVEHSLHPDFEMDKDGVYYPSHQLSLI